jgi:hypothetical protein
MFMNEPFEKTRFQRALELIIVTLMFTLSLSICTGTGRAETDVYLDEGEDSIEFHKFEYEEDFSWWEEEELEIPTTQDLVMLSAALEACPNGYRESHEAILKLIRLERELGVYDWIPGALLGVFCVESSYRVETPKGGKILGDYRDKVAMAHGPFQLWPINRRYCGERKGEAHDLEWSARCWVDLVERTYKKARVKCPDSAWRTAEAAVSNIAKYRWSCKLGSKHWKVAEEINAIYQRRIQGAL